MRRQENPTVTARASKWNPQGTVQQNLSHKLTSFAFAFRSYKFSNDASRDSDSLIQDYCDGSSQDFDNRSCFQHPKVRENWRMVLAATTLLFIGIGLLATGTIALAEPQAGLQGAVFLLAGFICFIPGAYHVS